MDIIKAVKRLGIVNQLYLGGKGKRWVSGIDITSRCNLRCKHCYWWRQKHSNELSDPQMIEFMQKLAKQGIKYVNILGGEPMLKPEVCKAAAKIFDSTVVFTNGTLGFPHIHTGVWAVSIDGTPKIHNTIRGKGVYEKFEQNVGQATNPVTAHVTISKLNYNVLPQITENMNKLGLDGINFSFYGGCKGKKGDDLLVPLNQRSKILDVVDGLRKEYGDFVLLTKRVSYYFRPEGGYYKWNSLENCPAFKEAICFTPDGKEKFYCPYGPGSECSTCGCANMPSLCALRDFDIETMKIVAKTWFNPLALK